METKPWGNQITAPAILWLHPGDCVRIKDHNIGQEMDEPGPEQAFCFEHTLSEKPCEETRHQETQGTRR